MPEIDYSKFWSPAFDTMDDFVFIADNDFNIIRANKSFLAFIRRDEKEIIGGKCYKLIHGTSEPVSECPHKRTIETKEFQHAELYEPWLKKWLYIHTTPIFDENHKLIGSFHIFCDFTERKKTEDKLRHIQAQLFQTSKLATLGEMSAGLAHEMNQPLSGISLTSKNLKKLMERGSLTNEDIKSAMTDIDSSIERMGRIIQHIRTFARQDTFKFVEVDVNKAMESAMGLLGEQLRLHEIEVIKEYSSNLPWITGEPYQIEQVIINIISNSGDALDERGKEHIKGYSKKLILKTERMKDEVCISISDNGIGMSQDVREKIFQPFFTTKEVGRATGLGLAISYGIIEAHKGRIEVESEKGKGTTVKVFLPVKIRVGD